MTCDDILELASSEDGGIEGQPEFIEHLKTCARCRKEAPALLAAARAIRAAPGEALAGHVTSDQIVTLAIDPEAAVLDVNRGAAAHVSSCATCTAELEEVRRAEQKRLSVERPRLGLGRLFVSLARPLPVRFALVTGVAVLLLAYPAYLGLRNLPRVKEQAAELEQRIESLEAQVRDLSASLDQANQASSRLSQWSGPVRLFNLTSPVRGERVTQFVSVDPAEPYVLVSVRPILAQPSSESDVYRLIIVGMDGRETWSSQVTAGEMRRQLRSSGALVFPIPSNRLVPGRHQLRVEPQKSPQEPILDIPFEIVPGE